MNKRIIIIPILAILLVATLSSTSAIAKNSSEEDQSSRLIWFESEIVIEAPSELDEPVMPLAGIQMIEITVKFRLSNMGPLASWYFFKRPIGKWILFRSNEIPSAKIELAIEYPTEWCTANLEPSTVQIEISNEFKEAEAKIRVSVDETAPAFETNNIIIKAEFKTENSWGIKDSNNETRISFMPDYFPVINITPETVFKEMPPAKATLIPINITNLGNGETDVIATITEYPEDWNVSVDSIEKLGVGDTAQVYLNVTPAKGFGKETIQLEFLPASTEDPSATGKVLTLNILLKNDGSLEEENEIPGFEILTLIIAVGISLVLLKRRIQ